MINGEKEKKNKEKIANNITKEIYTWKLTKKYNK